MRNLFTKAFTIREIIEDPAIFGQYEDPHGYISRCDEKWIELLRSNPYALDSDVAIILAIDENNVVGRLGFYAGQVCINDSRERTFWMDDFALYDSYRNSGAGGIIIMHARGLLKSLLGSGGPSHDAQRLYKAVGCQELGPLRRFLFFYHASLLAKRYIKNQILAGLFSAISTPFLRLYILYKIGLNEDNYLFEYRPVNQFKQEIDGILAQEKRNHFPRDSKTLNWVLCHRKFLAFEIYRDDELLGYCLLKIVHRKNEIQNTNIFMKFGYLVDYYLADHSRQAKEDLVLFSIRFFKEKDVELFECQVHDEMMAEVCHKYGMYERAGNKVFFKPKYTQKVALKSPWFLTLGTSDVILCL